MTADAPWVGHDCLPGQRDGIYVSQDHNEPEGARWTCPMCGTGWVRRDGQWETTPAGGT